MSTVQALIVPADPHQPMTSQPIQGTLPGLRAALNAHTIQAVSGWHDGQEWHAYVDEWGKLTGAALNARATAVARALGWAPGDVLAGAVVFLGMDPQGQEADVPGYVLTTAAAVTGQPVTPTDPAPPTGPAD